MVCAIVHPESLCAEAVVAVDIRRKQIMKIICETL